MRIGYANAKYHPSASSGGNAHVYQFIQNVQQLGHQVFPFSIDDKPFSLLKSLLLLSNLDVIYYRITFKSTKTLLLGRRPISKLVGSPLIVWEFNTIPEHGKLVGKSEGEIQKTIKRLNYFARDCSLAICVSDGLAEYVRTVFGIEKVIVVPNGSDPSKFHPGVEPSDRLFIDPDHLNVVWMGTAGLSWHNLDLIISTARILWECEEGKQISFHMIGQGLDPSANLPPNVRYYGPVRYDELGKWLSPMHVGLVLYKPGIADYNSPLKMFDYMSSGLMILGTPHPQIRQIYQQIGLSEDDLIPHNDPSRLARKLLDLSNNRQRVEWFGLAGRQLIIKKYNWQKNTKIILNEIEDLLALHQ